MEEKKIITMAEFVSSTGSSTAADIANVASEIEQMARNAAAETDEDMKTIDRSISIATPE